MIWNWQQKTWPTFTFQKDALAPFEEKFLRQSGLLMGTYKHIASEDRQQLAADLLSEEALKTSEIENEYLNRESLRSSLRRQFGLSTDRQKISPAEQGIAGLMADLYKKFSAPLSEKTLFAWHALISQGRTDLTDIGRYRTNAEDDPMQVVSPPDYKPTIHFEAPPSERIPAEMKKFIAWYNRTSPDGQQPLPALTRAAIAHIYFECIHPFEDGNGRIGRALSEKALSQSLGQPALTSLSQTIHKNKKAYYDRLELNNKILEIDDWLIYFAKIILAAQQRTIDAIEFLIEKTKLYDKARSKLNTRQEKALTRMFQEGLDGFKGGLSASNYIAITGASHATATRDLQDMFEQGILRRTGKLKGTRYWLNIKKSSSR